MVLFQFYKSTNSTPLVWSGPSFAFTVPSVSHVDLRVDQFHFVPNVGELRTSLDITNNEGSFNVGRGLVEMSDLRRGAWKLDVNAGDGPLNIYNLDLQLNALYKPLAGLRGAQMTASRGRTTFTAFGGRTTAINGFFADAVLVSDQSLYGARAVFSPAAKLELGTSLVHTAASGGTGLPLPRSTTAVTADAIYRWTPQVRLLGEVSLAGYSGSTLGEQPRGRDVSFLLGSQYNSEGRHAEVSYLRLSPHYMPLSSFNVGDRAGVYGSGDIELTKNVMVYGAYNHFNNNVVRSSLQPIYTVDSRFVGARYRLAAGTHLGARVGGGGVRSSGEGASLRDGRNRNLHVDFSTQVGLWRFLGRASDIRSTESATTRQQSLSRRAEVEIRRVWRNGTSVWATVGTLQERGPEQEQKRSSLTGNAGLTWTIRRAVSLYADAAWNQGLADLKTSSVDNVSFAAGLNWALPREMELSVYGRYTRDSSRLSTFDSLTMGPDSIADLESFLLNLQRNTYQITIRIQKSFKWGKRPVALAASSGSSGMPARVEVGTIEGVVFNDLNGDGLRSEEELGVPNVTVILDGRIKEPVHADGRFSFSNVPTGAHTVELEPTTVPASWDIGQHSRVTVSVTRKATVAVEFPLIQLGKLSGTVVIIDRPDPNIRRVTDAPHTGERPGANIIILLNDTLKVTMTDADGEFEFTSIPAGEYRLRIDESSLPEFCEVLSEKVQTVSISPGGRVSDLEFVVGASPRPIRRIFAPVQGVPETSPTKGPGQRPGTTDLQKPPALTRPPAF